MPDLTVLSDRGRRWRANLPPVLRNSAEYLASINAKSKEFDRLEATLDALRLEFNPPTATLLLAAWEYTFKLPVGGAGASIDQRRQRIVGRMRKMLGQSEGREWVQSVTDILGTNAWSYQEHDPADSGSPPAGTIRITLPFQTGTPIFAEAQQQLREITAAHLVLTFASSAGFQLDLSQMDITSFTY